MEKQKEEQQRKLLELQILINQINQIQKQLNLLDQQLMELITLKTNLDDIKKIKEDKDIFINLGSGIFVKGNLKENKEILMNSGSGVVVEKDIEDTEKIVEEQITELENLFNQMEQGLHQCAIESERLQEELKGLNE